MLHGSPWVCMYFHYHQMVGQAQPKGARGLLEVTQKLRFFQTTHVGLKTAILTSEAP